jgi:hypothetical protein
MKSEYNIYFKLIYLWKFEYKFHADYAVPLNEARITRTINAFTRTRRCSLFICSGSVIHHVPVL